MNPNTSSDHAVTPPPSHGLGEETVRQMLTRAASPGYVRWWGQIAATGYCAHPIRLRGTTADGTGVDTLIRCGNRRAAHCPSCSRLYAGDTWQLVHAGIAGGHHGIPATITKHPMVFLTLTAPSFGPVHTTHPSSAASGKPRQCRPRRDRPRCAHDRAAWCARMHTAADPLVGQPLCPDCYDYRAQVLFSWHAPTLWSRYTTALRRLVATTARNVGENPKALRVSYVRVVEMQRRAVPHIHAIARLDNRADPDTPPDTGISSAALADIAADAARLVRLDVAGPGGEIRTVRFGAQTDTQVVTLAASASPEAVAAYLAKYVTKSSTDLGLRTRRLSAEAVERIDVTDHVRTVLRTAVALADLPGHEAILRHLHTLAYPGQITTKSRAYSTTLSKLREQRAIWTQGRHNDQRSVPVDWTHARPEPLTTGDRALITAADTSRHTARQAARTEHRDAA